MLAIRSGQHNSHWTPTKQLKGVKRVRAASTTTTTKSRRRRRTMTTSASNISNNGGGNGNSGGGGGGGGRSSSCSSGNTVTTTHTNGTAQDTATPHQPPASLPTAQQRSATTAVAIATTPAQQQQQQQQQQQPNARTMQSDEDFNIRFVNLVKAHKCLYDKKVPEYRNRDNQEKAWTLISQETRESVIHCKERWRNLRACLSRYIKQQSCADPQHKPYYLTEHMSFLLPFLKSTRNSLDNGNHSLATLFQFQHHHQHLAAQQPTNIQLIAPSHLQHLEMKHSLSDNDDEETIDAFDPVVTGSLQMQSVNNNHSPPLSDTASANTLQNFIPDVQLAELRTPEPTQEITYVTTRQESRDFTHEPAKRIKTECHSNDATTTTTAAHLQMYSCENSDMEFFRSILPDIAALTPQQKRKFKIGILELIDDVLERFPAERSAATSSSASAQTRRSSQRDWRK